MRDSVLLTICAHCYNVNTYCLGLRVEFIKHVFYDYDDGKIEFIMGVCSNTS